MYFKKLELVGFKSFLNKTTLHFEPGITAVVGPNGTGKSNIFDSIRWVLGEQSIKALRGSDMQDVIFNGTDAKEPLSMAEVTLTFDNHNRFFNLDHNEVAISRRIFRSGESEYLLNKSLVRLKDILDILMGTGIGAESYSLVAQGQIDLILSSRPEDRRLVFDEAAGITKYKAQKKETARKLEETEANLLRVGDIILEVKRQIASLERQANKARRYREIFEELRLKEIALAILQKRKILGQKDEIIKELSKLKEQEIKAMEAVREQELATVSRQEELKVLQNNIMAIRNEILNLDNLVIRNKERVSFNQKNLTELDANYEYLKAQAEQIRHKLFLDEEKLNSVREEYTGIQKNITAKTEVLKNKEEELGVLNSTVRSSLENIARTKKEIWELAIKVTSAKNEIADSLSRNQIHLARKKRLELEKVKTGEEKGAAESQLKQISRQLQELDKISQELNSMITGLRNESTQEGVALNKINSQIEHLEKEILTLSSHKEFIEKLKTRYDDIGESMQAVIYLDKLPQEGVSGLLVKINAQEQAGLKLSGEAKPIDLDTQRLNQKLNDSQRKCEDLKDIRQTKEDRIKELLGVIRDLEKDLKQQDIALANKKAAEQSVSEQFNKIKEEEEVILLELSDVERDISLLAKELNGLKADEADLEREHREKEEIIADEQNKISANTSLKEKVLVEIAENKTSLEALRKRIGSDKATLGILEDTYRQDKDNLLNIERQMEENRKKKESLLVEIGNFEDEIKQTAELREDKRHFLAEAEDIHQKNAQEADGAFKRIESLRKELATLKNRLHELEMQDKDIDFKFLSLKERLLENYKADLETIEEQSAAPQEENALSQEIEGLKKRSESLGTVNLVAIEEHDDLKKRYDFLSQQQNDLVCAKKSLYEAMLKLNRTTKQMFQETFQRVAGEFRNYFRLLFGGGDARVFLIDEQDPLESGIEIICRPPGKKLQNVLLLSGGEKALSAIAMIFAIFKVKPSPFCVLDEIDAALDEANVDRFSRLLQEFSKEFQFIVITHNKRTIANADVMYGITMEDSGISKIVSVKFAKDAEKDRALVAETV